MGPVSRPAPLSAPSPRGFGRGPSSVSARRHRVVWSGTARSSPSRPMTEPISPSVCRSASRNTALNVSAVRIARSEYSGCPPRLVRRSASHASTASSENQTVTLPRQRRLSSYSRQFVTLRFCSGMWWRRSWFSLKGKAGIPGQTEGRPATSIGPRALPVGSLQQRDVHRPVIRALDLTRRYAETRVRAYPVEEDVPLDGIVRPLWRDAVVDQHPQGCPRIDRITYEICALEALPTSCARRCGWQARTATATPTRTCR